MAERVSGPAGNMCTGTRQHCIPASPCVWISLYLLVPNHQHVLLAGNARVFPAYAPVPARGSRGISDGGFAPPGIPEGGFQPGGISDGGVPFICISDGGLPPAGRSDGAVPFTCIPAGPAGGVSPVTLPFPAGRLSGFPKGMPACCSVIAAWGVPSDREGDELPAVSCTHPVESIAAMRTANATAITRILFFMGSSCQSPCGCLWHA